jgi:transposase InsO family protein
MKSLARSYVWWPHLDGQIKDIVSSCEVCQALRADPPKAQVHPWMFPEKPWSRLHVDYAGPIGGFMYLVLVDAYSKFPEVVKMKSTTSTSTINVLRSIFSRQGLPEVLVSDNGPQFVSSEFQKFCSLNGVVHLTSAVHKPSTNGQAE